MLKRRQFITMGAGWYKWFRAKRKSFVTTFAKIGILWTCVLNANKTEKTKQKATMTTYLATNAEYDKTIVSMKTATASHAEPHEASANVTSKMTVKAHLFGYLRAPVKMMRGVFMSVVAAVDTIRSVLFGSNKQVRFKVGADMIGVQGSLAKIRENAAVGVSASATAAVAMFAASTNTETTRQSARLRWWFSPEIDENGSLYIQQAHTITQYDDTLEVK